MRVTKALGGRFIDMNGNGSAHINIMDLALSGEKNDSAVSDKVGTVKTFLSIAAGGLSPREEGLCDGCILKTYSRRGFTDASVSEKSEAVAADLTSDTALFYSLTTKDENGDLDISIDAVKANYEGLDFVCEVL